MGERSVPLKPRLLTDITSMFRRRQPPPPATVLTEGVAEYAVSSAGEPDERLVALFKNRAELKKAFSDLRRENDQLRDRLARIESSPAHDQQRLAALEARLSERETGYPALVYFQLRGLWRFCHTQLQEFSDQLQEQHQEREYKIFADDFRELRNRELVTIDERLKLVRGEYSRQHGTLKRLTESQERLRGFWNHFRRKRLQEQLDEQQGVVAEVKARMDELDARRIKTVQSPVPEFPGLTADARRNINLAVLAFAQYLYVAFSDNRLATLSHNAMHKTVHDVRYGSQADCEALINLIDRAVKAMAARRGYGDELRMRARHLKLRCAFDSQAATIPREESLGQFPLDFHHGTAGVQVDVNVLADDYWNVREVLLH